MRTANWVMFVLYLFSVAVQYNDPDPIQWMTIYGAAALACFFANQGNLKWWVPVLITGVAVLWALGIAPAFFGKFDFFRMFESWKMTDSVIEVEREVGGLFIVAGWMLFLAYQLHKNAK